MAFKGKKKGGFPSHNIMLSVKVGDEYKQCKASCGLWPNDGKGPELRGSIDGERLEKIASFLSKAAEKDLKVSVSLFKSKPKKKRDEDDDDERDSGSKDDSDDFDL